VKVNQKTLNFEKVGFLKIEQQLAFSLHYTKKLSVLVNNAG
jgi:hypothetical protein